MSNAFVIIKMCYVHSQWYDISCDTLYIKSQKMHFSVYELFYSHSSLQHHSAGIPATLRVMLLYKNTKIQM